ncbi:MAG TPA: hypothetical protein VN066_01650 [Rhodocyclaceae bacterium]|jgi:hypothetical protein|nr:hypothetical protein [Rhodocyclaceae bacterium]
MQNLPDYPDQPELALVAALTLISRYSCCRSPALADAAVSQLQTVASDSRFSNELRECAGQLAEFWLQRSATAAAVDRSVLH